MRPSNNNQTCSIPTTSNDVNIHYHINDQRHNRRQRPSNETSFDSGQLKYGAKSVIDLFVPVSICMSIVVGTMKATDSYDYSDHTTNFYTVIMFSDQSVDTETRIWHSFLNAMMMLGLIVCMTTLLIVLYKFKFYKIIYGWLLLSSSMLLTTFMVMYIVIFLKVYNIPMDKITLYFFIWNFAVVGLICIHWKGPLKLQQAYLIMVSALMALVFIQCLPDWTVWSVLMIVSVWDLVAVLCPMGPLRMLVELAQERDEPIFPALIYSSTMIWELVASTAVLTTMTMADGDNSNAQPTRSDQETSESRRTDQQSESSKGQNKARKIKKKSSTPLKPSDQQTVQYDNEAGSFQVAIRRHNSENSANISGPDEQDARDEQSSLESGNFRSSTTRLFQVDHSTISFNHSTNSLAGDEIRQLDQEEDRGVKLGLGDFIFFSVLVGKASTYGDWTITMSCYVSVLIGLCLTLSLLSLFRKALPALPISIAFGLASALLSHFFAVPLVSDLNVNQIFI